MIRTQTLWATGDLRCVLVQGPTGLFVHVVNNEDRPLVSEPCADPDDAAQRAEYLFGIFTNQTT